MIDDERTIQLKGGHEGRITERTAISREHEDVRGEVFGVRTDVRDSRIR
jgi:hypothetical protein